MGELDVSALTQAHFISALKWIDMMSEPSRWNLTTEEVATLLGDMEPNHYSNLKRSMKIGTPILLSEDVLERLSLLLTISRLLTNLAPTERESLAFEWFNKPNNNTLFNGKSIKHYILENRDIKALYDVRRYLTRE